MKCNNLLIVFCLFSPSSNLLMKLHEVARSQLSMVLWLLSKNIYLSEQLFIFTIFLFFQSSYQRSGSYDKVRRLVKEEGRMARNLVTWNVPVDSDDSDGKNTFCFDWSISEWTMNRAANHSVFAGITLSFRPNYGTTFFIHNFFFVDISHVKQLP